MGIKRPYYLLEPRQFIPEVDGKPLLGRFVTDFRNPVAHPQIGDDNDLVSIIKPHTNSFEFSAQKNSSSKTVGASLSLGPLVEAKFRKSAHQIIDLSRCKTVTRGLRDPTSAFM
jgi:hypothetical protein